MSGRGGGGGMFHLILNQIPKISFLDHTSG
jgi:hypothetical protein